MHFLVISEIQVVVVINFQMEVAFIKVLTKEKNENKYEFLHWLIIVEFNFYKFYFLIVLEKKS